MEKNLSNEEALNKFVTLVKDIETCMFITNTSEEHDHTRPMATVDVDEDGTLYFFTDIRSIKVEEVSMHKRVHLVYAHPGKESYLDVWGKAQVLTDRGLIAEKWSPIVRAYFPQGKDDPNIALLKVRPHDVYYWSAEAGKMVSFLKMAVSAITGKRPDQAASGDLNL